VVVTQRRRAYDGVTKTVPPEFAMNRLAPARTLALAACCFVGAHCSNPVVIAPPATPGADGQAQGDTTLDVPPDVPPEATPTDAVLPDVQPRRIDGAGDAAIDEVPASATDTSDAPSLPDVAEVPDVTELPDVGDTVEAAAPCNSPAECPPAKPFCQSATGACVACLHGGHCKVLGARCIAGQCQPPVPCQSSKQCKDGLCDAKFGFCVDCVTTVDCAPGLQCKANQCVPPGKPCKSTKECKDAAELCDAKAGACTECLGAVDCGDGLACLEGLCMPPPPKICTPGQKQCQAAGLATCSADGQVWTVAPCPDKTVCFGEACKAQVCAPGLNACDGNKVTVCDAQGLGTQVVQDCGATAKTCVDGKCLDLLCKAGTKQCQGDKLATCAPDGKAWNLASCDDGNACTDDTCDPKTLACASAPGSKGCDDGVASEALFMAPTGIAATAAGALMVSDVVAVRRISAPPVDCDDKQPCTTDACDPKTGKCSNTATPDGGGCKSGKFCV
jgi:hypothetical protein